MTTAFPLHSRLGAASVRYVLALVVTLGLILVLVLGPAAYKSQAATMLGTLRSPGEPALIAGHRGDRSVAPENTMPALSSALSGSMVFVETDIRLTADGVPVLIHDATVDRTTNGKGPVSSFTLAELQRLDAGSWHSAEHSGVRIPTLDDFLAALADSDKKGMLELKGKWSADSTLQVMELIGDHGVQSRVVFTSFDADTLAGLAEVAPDIPRLVLTRDLPKDPVALVRDYGAIGVITSAQSVEADPAVVDLIHSAGFGILLYTLNKEQSWASALSLGVDGIITDKPSSLDSWLAQTAPGT